MRNICIFLIKPDALELGLVDEIKQEIVFEELTIITEKTVHLDETTIRAYQPALNLPSDYGEGWKQQVISFLTSRPVLVMIAKGSNAIAKSNRIKEIVRTRHLSDATPLDKIIRNLIHTASSLEDLNLSISIFFPELASD